MPPPGPRPTIEDPIGSPAARACLLALTVALVLDLVGIVAELPWLVTLAKPWLMPLLAGWVLLVTPRPLARPVGWLLAGLGLAWLGDLALLGDGDTAFLVGLVCFLGMQVAYLLAFAGLDRGDRPGLVRSRPWLGLPYLAVWLVMNGWLHGGVGTRFVPVLGYSAVLVTMAARALDVSPRLAPPFGRWLAAGGALFVVSDGILAATAFDAVSAGRGWDVVVMTTYVAAQVLIAAGLTRGARSGPGGG